MYTKKLGRINNKHSYLITAEHVANIWRRYQSDSTDGMTAEVSDANALQAADGDRLLAENGRTA